MAFLIRKNLMKQGEGPFDNGQAYECDETYIGGKERGAAGRPGPTNSLHRNKTAVFGIVQRKGKVAAVAVPDVKGETVFPHIQKRALQGSTIHTDDYNLYRSLSKMGYKHERIKHSQYVYVSGDVHTNTIEGFWSLTKRGINGVYHAVSKKHLQGYLNEYAWRYNHRAEGKAQFELLLLRAAAGH